MGPHLASLALLLLALCRQVATDDLPAPPAAVPKEKFDAAMGKGGYGFSVLFALVKATAPDTLTIPAYAQKAFDNGVQCAYAETGLDQAIATDFYGGPKDDQLEKNVAGNLGIKCAQPDTDAAKCFCTDQKTILYCAGKNYLKTITSTKGTCSGDALTNLKTAAPTLSKAFDYAKLSQRPEEAAIKDVFSGAEGSIDAITKQEAAEMKKFFCEATETKVETAVKELFASEFSYIFVEQAVLAIAIAASGGDASKLDEDCTDDWKKGTFGECLCARDRGFTFCLYKALGELFKETGYLTCEAGQEAFVPTNKPDVKALPQKLAPPKKPPTTTTPTQPSAAPASAAATSSLLLPFSAAATLLMLRH